MSYALGKQLINKKPMGKRDFRTSNTPSKESKRTWNNGKVVWMAW
jgi:hypothetical protein